MARREIDTIWDRETRNNINENFIELYNEYIGAGLDAKEARKKAEQALNIANQSKQQSQRAEDKADNVQEQFNQVVIEGDSSVEAAQARVDADGNTYNTLKERLDEKETEFSSQLAETPYYDEITYQKYRDDLSETDYYITHIPNKDRNGDLIELKHGYQNDLINSGNGETARSFSNRHNASLVVNASVWNMETGNIIGVQIKDGEILHDGKTVNAYILGIKADNTLVIYPPGTSAQTVLNDGCVNAVTAFTPLINNGQAVDHSGFVATNPNEPYQRQVIGQLSNKDIIILTTQGKTKTNPGMTYDDCARILLDKGVVTAYVLDGGGSTSTVVRGIMINNPTDEAGKSERRVADFLYIKKPVTNPEKLKTVSEDLGFLGKKVSDALAEIENKVDMLEGYIRLKASEGEDFQGIESWEGDERLTKLFLRKNALTYHDYKNNDSIFLVEGNGDLYTRKGFFGTFLRETKTITNLNTLTESGLYFADSTATGVPSTDTPWFVVNFYVSNVYIGQLAIPNSTSKNAIMYRRTIGGAFGEWRNMLT